MLSVIIPAYRNSGHVARLLASMQERTAAGAEYEVIVVDDGSPDDAIVRTCAAWPQVRVIRQPKNQGAAAARNAGAAAASGDRLLFFDSDMVLLSDAVTLMDRAFDDARVDAAVGAVSPHPVNPGLFNRFWGLVKAYSQPAGPYANPFYPMVGAIRRSVFERIGGFEARIQGASVEDYEISMRLEAAGCRVHFLPGALVGTHYKGWRKSLAQSFFRAGKWVVLFAGRPRFDGHTTTGSQAAAMLSGAALTAAISGWLAGAVPGPVPASLLGVYLVLNRKFFQYVLSICGPAFVPAAVLLNTVLACVVTAGAARGALYLLTGRDRSRALLYRA